MDKRIFFDDLASRWDTFEPFNIVVDRITEKLVEFSIAPSEKVLDVGCGTGNLSLALLRTLGSNGKIVAVDLSQTMIDTAKTKTTDNRIDWITSYIENFNSEFFFDRIICYSVWPHFENRTRIAYHLNSLLKQGGYLHIWHTISKEKVNSIHAMAHESVMHDTLNSTEIESSYLAESGFEIVNVIDDDSGYLITAVKIK
jgi:demethylmenaquinone methyltransferase/2-methoxy-6-polyprenyl-1,4-benzoquinol methylase